MVWGCGSPLWVLDVLLSVVGVPRESSFLVVVLNAFIAAAHMPFLFPGSALLLLSHAWDAIPIPLCHAAWTACVIFAGSYPLGLVAFFLYCPLSSSRDPAASCEKCTCRGGRATSPPSVCVEESAVFSAIVVVCGCVASLCLLCVCWWHHVGGMVQKHVDCYR